MLVLVSEMPLEVEQKSSRSRTEDSYMLQVYTVKLVEPDVRPHIASVIKRFILQKAASTANLLSSRGTAGLVMSEVVDACIR